MKQVNLLVIELMIDIVQLVELLPLLDASLGLRVTVERLQRHQGPEIVKCWRRSYICDVAVNSRKITLVGSWNHDGSED